MNLSRKYDSLNTRDGVMFTASSNGSFYTIDSKAKTERIVGSVDSDVFTGQAWCGDDYIAMFDHSRSKILFSKSNDYKSIDAWVNLGWHHFGTILFTKEKDDAGILAVSFD